MAKIQTNTEVIRTRLVTSDLKFHKISQIRLLCLYKLIILHICSADSISTVKLEFKFNTAGSYSTRYEKPDIPELL